MTPIHKLLRKTQSVCPVCLQRVDAGYFLRGEEVWLEKTCPQHGFFEALLWQGEASFQVWQAEPVAQPPRNPEKPVQKGCPYDCGLCGAHRQASCCVLLEVTARCNLACPVCFAAAKGDEAVAQDPGLDVIAGWYDMLLEKGGPFNIQLSGGEPTMRDDLPEILELGTAKGFSFFQLNTNGLRLAQDLPYLTAMARAGLKTVFLQFDSLRPGPTLELRGADLVEIKRAAIEHCAKAGVGVVLVPTVKPGCNEDELWDILRFASEFSPAIRGVHFQPISYFGRYAAPPQPGQHLTVPRLLQLLEIQSGGRVCAAHFSPGWAEHPMCSFHADYELEAGGWRLKRRAAGCCCAQKIARPTSERARRAVALKWSMPNSREAAPDSRYRVDSLDAFLEGNKRRAIAVSGMAFQDAWTLDLQRLQRCHVHVVSPEGVLVPFCAYNLTAQDGSALYRR